MARAGVLVQLALDRGVHPVHDREHLVGLGPGAEENGLEHLRCRREPLEGEVAVARVLGGADVVAGVERAHDQRPLAVEQADSPLALDPAQDRLAAGEVAAVHVAGLAVAASDNTRYQYSRDLGESAPMDATASKRTYAGATGAERAAERREPPDRGRVRAARP